MMRNHPKKIVIPAQAGIHERHLETNAVWIPCHSRVGGNFAGMTKYFFVLNENLNE